MRFWTALAALLVIYLCLKRPKQAAENESDKNDLQFLRETTNQAIVIRDKDKLLQKLSYFYYQHLLSGLVVGKDELAEEFLFQVN